MPAGDVNDNTLATLVQCLQNISKTGVVNKPSIFNRNIPVTKHLTEVNNYISFINAKNSSDKSLILWESLAEEIKNEIIFDATYEIKCNDYEWLKEKLEDICPDQSNKTTELITLNELKQNRLTPQQFANIIKQELGKRRNVFSLDEMHALAIKIFVSGLDDENVATAIKRQKPDSIEDALKMCSTITKQSNLDGQVFHVKQESCNCLNELKMLNGKVEYLQQLLISYQRTLLQSRSNLNKYSFKTNAEVRNQHSRFPYQNITPQEPRKQQRFMNQNFPKQANKTRFNVQCYKCGRFGHISRFCDTNNRPTVRCMQNRTENTPTINTRNDNQETFSNQSFEEASVNEIPMSESNDAQAVYFLEQTTRIPAVPTSKKQVKTKKEKKYPEEICKLAAIIEDPTIKSYKEALTGKLCHTVSTMSVPSTLITKRNSEKAKNKPIVWGKINNAPQKFLLDTGADINLIDKNYAKNTLNIKLDLTNNNKSQIRCANGSPMQALGTIKAEIEIGKSVACLDFVVVENMFPEIILGIVALKELNVDLSPSKSCAITKNLIVPFVSKVGKSKNVCELLLRVGKRL